MAVFLIPLGLGLSQALGVVPSPLRFLTLPMRVLFQNVGYLTLDYFYHLYLQQHFHPLEHQMTMMGYPPERAQRHQRNGFV